HSRAGRRLAPLASHLPDLGPPRLALVADRRELLGHPHPRLDAFGLERQSADERSAERSKSLSEQLPRLRRSRTADFCRKRPSAHGRITPYNSDNSPRSPQLLPISGVP